GQAQGQAVPHRSPGLVQRPHPVRSAGRRRDGAAPRRHPAPGGRGRRGAGLPLATRRSDLKRRTLTGPPPPALRPHPAPLLPPEVGGWTMTHEEEMRSLARGAAIALLAVIGALVLHLRSEDRPRGRVGAVAAKSAKSAKTPTSQVAETPQP